MVKRSVEPVVSAFGERFLGIYEKMLQIQENFTAVSIHNCLSDLRHFVTWYEQKSMGVQGDSSTFTPDEVVPPTITRYRAYLQREC